MNEHLQKVMQKVAHLRALAAKAGTQAEAETAAAQAEAMIAKYQLDEATIETSTTCEERVGEDEPLWSGGRSEQWRGALCAGLCKDHGCAAVAEKQGNRTVYRIAGRPSDLAIVRYLFAWLSSEIDRLSKHEDGRSAQNGFRVGAVIGVLQAMRASRAEEVKAAPQGASAAMVIVSHADESLAYLKQAIGGRFRAAASRSVDSGAFERGKAAGANLAPRQALSGRTVLALTN